MEASGRSTPFQHLEKHGFDAFFDIESSFRAGDFEQVILDTNPRRARHFVAVLTPSCLDRVDEPGILFRREILNPHCIADGTLFLGYFQGFSPSDAEAAGKLTGDIVAGLEKIQRYFGRLRGSSAAMARLRTCVLGCADRDGAVASIPLNSQRRSRT